MTDLFDDTQEQEGVVPAALANHYVSREQIITTKGPEAARASLEMWTAVMEIAQAQSWRARFSSQNEWIAHLTDLNIYGLSRANIMSKLRTQRDLISANASPQMAAIAAAVIPAAADELNTYGKMRQAAKDQKPDDYLGELLTLPNPGEAVRRVRQDKGNSVSLWVQDVALIGGKVVGLIVREDNSGYTSFDFTLEIRARGKSKVDDILNWMVNLLKGHRGR